MDLTFDLDISEDVYDFLRLDLLLAVMSDDCGFKVSLLCVGIPLSTTFSQETIGLEVFAKDAATFALLAGYPRGLPKVHMLLDFMFFWLLDICTLVLASGCTKK